jgi:hypothetical protein
MTSDVEFVEHYETVLQKCRSMIDARPEEKIPTFQWLFVEGHKGFNWMRVLEGAYDWALVGGSGSRSRRESEREAQIARLMKMAEEEAEIQP